MEVFLFSLLVLAITGLVFVSFYAIQQRMATVRLETEITQWNEFSTKAKAQYKMLVNKYNENAKKWNEHTTALKEENYRLSKWKNVADAEAKASEILRDARAIAEKAKSDAENLIADAQQRASSLKSETEQQAAAELANVRETTATLAGETRRKVKAQRDEAQAILISATSQAASIVEAATNKAKEIGGSAYEAMKNAALYERSIRSMKNIIEGYGNQYIIPPHSLLDDLAEDYGHTQAGQELKRARECTKVMIRNSTAAACEYVEANRQETAINFVVDAFNGKVDSILSRVKHDNAGKLQEEIRDAFNLVNLNGKAFRDARITEQYLAARLEELKWAAIAQQLALQEREEQRHAKEQAREEARAAKEREKALRDAVKEEEILRKAMDQAREQFAEASGEQKTMYEDRLRDMEQRLQEALERKERARSMAEQTKKGSVYIISNIGSFGDDVYKIGLTRRWDPQDRIDELGGASVPFGFDVHAIILSDDAPALERRLHRHSIIARSFSERP